MTPEERKVIGGIFDRLREAASQPRDPEAERFIADRIREQPYAPYVMAQSIFVQEQAVENLSQQVQQLQAEVEELRRYADQAARQPQQSGGFLSGLFGGGQQAAPPPPRRAPFSGGRAPFGGGAPMQQQPAPGPWGAAAQQRWASPWARWQPSAAVPASSAQRSPPQPVSPAVWSSAIC